jgi:hypothetical protein
MRNDIEKKRLHHHRPSSQQTEQADQLELQIKRKAEDARATKQIGITLQLLQAEVATHKYLCASSWNSDHYRRQSCSADYANESIDIAKTSSPSTIGHIQHVAHLRLLDRNL